MAFEFRIYYKESSSMPHAVAMSRLNCDQDGGKNDWNLVNYLSPNIE